MHTWEGAESSSLFPCVKSAKKLGSKGKDGCQGCQKNVWKSIVEATVNSMEHIWAHVSTKVKLRQYGGVKAVEDSPKGRVGAAQDQRIALKD